MSTLAEVLLQLLPSPVRRCICQHILLSAFAAMKWTQSAFGKNIFLYLNLRLYLRVHTGRNQMLQGVCSLPKEFAFPRASGWKWQWDGSAALDKGGPIPVTDISRQPCLSAVTLLEHFHPASWFIKLSGCFKSTNRRNTWTNSQERRSQNIITWKSPFVWAVSFF